MPAVRKNIVIERGTTFRLHFRMKQNGSYVDLTGHVMRMAVRESYSSDPVLELDSGAGGGITITAAEGRVIAQVEPADTEALAIERGVYDLEDEAADGFVRRIFYGDVLATREATS